MSFRREVLLEDRIDLRASTRERMKAVFRVVMEDTAHAGGIPTDALQQASPLDTYDLMESGRARGWCENVALVYYLFANAAGVSTRLVDMAGKFGPLKLTGHYVCECWIPEQAKWCYMDPQSRIASVFNPEGKPLHTLEIKRLVDTGLLDACRVERYDETTEGFNEEDAGAFEKSIRNYLRGDIVLAYKFGYARNRNFPRWRNFIFYPTLLYAPFPLPRLYRKKKLLLLFLVLSIAFALTAGWWMLIDVSVF
ncbi:MAG: hypothetical protein FJY97_19560 [candidate division Zixibacteria bacterium]|nr:hypothetical protein [candidate division Zixibacteria bacterium]